MAIFFSFLVISVCVGLLQVGAKATHGFAIIGQIALLVPLGPLLGAKIGTLAYYSWALYGMVLFPVSWGLAIVATALLALVLAYWPVAFSKPALWKNKTASKRQIQNIKHLRVFLTDQPEIQRDPATYLNDVVKTLFDRMPSLESIEPAQSIRNYDAISFALREGRLAMEPLSARADATLIGELEVGKLRARKVSALELVGSDAGLEYLSSRDRGDRRKKPLIVRAIANLGALWHVIARHAILKDNRMILTPVRMSFSAFGEPFGDGNIGYSFRRSENLPQETQDSLAVIGIGPKTRDVTVDFHAIVQDAATFRFVREDNQKRTVAAIKSALASKLNSPD